MKSEPEIIVSDCDKTFFLSHSWIVGNNGYVYLRGGRTKGKQCLLHRLILQAKTGEEVHHKNNNPLDNRRNNLELTTASEHQKHHVYGLIERNVGRRKHSLIGNCENCKAEFNKNYYHAKNNRFCSRKCSALFNWRKRK